MERRQGTTFKTIFAEGCGVLRASGGGAVAILSLRFLLPIDPARRLSSLMIAIVRDLIAMAEADSRLKEKCRARMHHRGLRMLAHASKLDNDLSVIVEGGLAALAIGTCLQRLRETEIKEGIPLVASGAIQESSLRLSAAILRPGELTVLEEVSRVLCRAMEAHHEANTTSVHSAFHALRGAPVFPSGMLS